MSDAAIRARGLGKRYRIGSQQALYATLRERLTEGFAKGARGVLRRSREADTSDKEPSGSIWALRDVSFDIERGETVGIIGLNGAGKTTLLKVLSRITEPTEGRAEIYGRVGSLLEAGTGFHPELTGRENVYLNGAILGMRKVEIDARFDAIAAFAEVERFLDTPVKRYSSGMYMRLAFSVAAHMEPQVLMVDEVLAVGDAQFQKRCFAKMQEIGKEERTVLFVSHNMSAVRSICNRGLLIERGRMVDDGDIDGVIDRYLVQSGRNGSASEVVETDSFVVIQVAISSPSSPVIKTFEPLVISVTLRAKTEIRDPGLYVGFLTLENQRVAGLDFKDFHTASALPAGEYVELRFSVDAFPVLPGSYRLELHVKDMASHTIEIVPRLFPFEVVEVPVYGGRKLDRWFGNVGLVAQASAHSLPRPLTDTSAQSSPEETQ